MFTIVLGILTAVAIFSAVDLTTEMSKGWSIFFGVLGYVVVQLTVSLILRQKMKGIQNNLQAVMQGTQKNIERKQQMFIHQRNMNLTMQRMQMEAEQKKGLEAALAVCDQYKPLFRWSPFVKKQVITMKVSFLFQQKNWEEVDRLLPDCLFLDPFTVCMGLVRKYKTKAADLDKFYKKRTRILRKDSCVLPAATYSWILLKLGRKEDAMKALNEALKKTDNAILARNRDAIANDKLKQFSNADLAETWYALGLEEPKMPKIQQRVAYR